MNKCTIKWVLLTLSLGVLSLPVGAAKTIKLQSTFVGDKEQPSVTYIMPWKPPEGPEKLYRPIDSISNNILDPIDRDELLRGVHYYDEMSLEGKH